MIPMGMTLEDAKKDYEQEKQVITGNDGIFKIAGIECIDCNEVHDKADMRYCKCDEGMVCQTCCSKCIFNSDGNCGW